MESQERLDKVLKRRDHLRSEVQRVTGRLDAARQELESVEQECRDKGVAPEKLDAAITQLEQRYEEAISDLEERVGEAEEALEPFVGEEE
jgi:chromosome segregation ATPase